MFLAVPTTSGAGRRRPRGPCGNRRWRRQPRRTGRDRRGRSRLRTSTDAERLLELIRNLDDVPVARRTTERIDDALIRDLFADSTSMLAVCKRDPERFRKLVTDDETARDIIAIAHRRQQVERFRKLLQDDVYFEAERARSAERRAESVWQRFFDENPWILGISLAGQLLTSWSHEKLEQVVAGSSISGPGKRADALLRTAGRIKSLVFAEFKTHKT